MKPGFEPIWAWPWVLLCCMAMLAVVAIGYPRRIRHLPGKTQRLLMTLRIVLVLLLTFWLLRPMVVIDTDGRSDAILYVLMDNSRSMETPDAAGGLTRRQALLDLFHQAQPLLDQLGESVEIRIRELADDLQPVSDDGPAATASGTSTAIGLNLDQLARESAQEKIAAILFWGDGRQAASGQRDIDPLQAARLLGREHRPLYTVPFGTADVSSSGMDLAVSELDVAGDVFVRNVVPVKVRLRAFGAQGRPSAVRILVEDRTGVAQGKSGKMVPVAQDRDNITVVPITAATESDDTIVSLQFVPQLAGEFKIAVEVDTLDGEVRTTNNRVETMIRVRSGGIRVAYLDRLRWEMKFLRRINVSNRIQLDFAPVRIDDRTQNSFDASWFEPGNYDAFIIGDVPAGSFTDEQQRQLFQCCEQGAGLMLIGGEHAFGVGGWEKTEIARLLPITMTAADQQLTGDIPMLPTRASQTNPILQIASPDQNAARWNSLPPLTGASLLRIKEGSGAQVLAESPTKVPLLVGQNTGRGRVLAFAGDTTWQWALEGGAAADAHERFWRQVIFWLTKMEYDGETPLWVTADPRDLSPGQTAELAFGLRDENGDAVNGVSYQVIVTGPDGTGDSVAARTETDHAAADYRETLDPGDYWVNVSADAGSGRGTLYAATRFLVNARDPELDNPAADPALMQELAHLSGGDFLTPDSMVERLSLWARNGLPSLQLKRSERINLWDNWYSLLLFVILIGTEWYLRKKRGLV
ncbi:MAG: glutamine amidotransferase [Planctomycetaceae bacterium]